jgi:hypothetical protein
VDLTLCGQTGIRGHIGVQLCKQLQMCDGDNQFLHVVDLLFFVLLISGDPTGFR